MQNECNGLSLVMLSVLLKVVVNQASSLAAAKRPAKRGSYKYQATETLGGQLNSERSEAAEFNQTGTATPSRRRTRRPVSLVTTLITSQACLRVWRACGNVSSVQQMRRPLCFSTLAIGLERPHFTRGACICDRRLFLSEIETRKVFRLDVPNRFN